MSRFINPFTDWGFKKIFGQEANKDILITFLNVLLKDERVITDITFLDKERLGETSDDRSLIYDIFCTTDTGEHIIVEMQNKRHDHFIDRSVYYLSRAVSEQARRGEWNYEVTAVYGVFLMNFKESQLPEPKLRTDMILADKATGRQICDKQRYIYLQLPYFDKREEECDDLFDCIIYVLKKMEVLNRMPFEKKNFIFAKLAEIAEVRKLTEEERTAYDVSLRKYRDTKAVINMQKAEGRAEGLAEGMAKGRAEGMAEGRAEGMAKGRAEGMAEGKKEEKIAIAANLKRIGLPIEQIAIATGLSTDEIGSL